MRRLPSPVAVPVALAAALVAVGVAACGPTVISQHPTDMGATVVGPDLSIPLPCGKCPFGTFLCDEKTHTCVQCLSDRDCDLGSVCQAGKCAPGCSATHGCGTNGTCDVDAGTCRSCNADSDCAKMPGKTLCDQVTGKCSQCSPLRDTCPEGQACDVSTGTAVCKKGCKGDWECIVGSDGGINAHCCNHTCVDVTTTTQHCGLCGNACAAGSVCCNGGCSNLMTDPLHCGSCDNACGGLFVQPTCKAGVCGASGCQKGHADCDGNAANGCETVVDSDDSNCGACGMKCALPNVKINVCFAGACVVGTCIDGYKDCDGKAQNGCEVSYLTDQMNCGYCNAACTQTPHAVAACQQGACAISACEAGFSDCNRTPNDGCESQTDSDPMNCGACGRICVPPPNTTATCQNGVCGRGPCLMGFSDCDNILANGCEANLATDAANCGKCRNVCLGQGQNANAACVNSMCTLSCLGGYADCDKNAANGCEVALNTDANNCGACGMKCPNNAPICKAGVCTQQFCHTTGYANCPGTNTWCSLNPINPNDQNQALAACSACRGAPCNLTNGDCAGPGYCFGWNGQTPCWGWQAGCSGAAGRVWQYGSSYSTYGFWGN